MKKFPKLMGIVNVTPDSFSDGGLHDNFEQALSHSLLLLYQGADIIDIGGESTRPGAMEVDENKEIHRVIPLIKEIKKLKNDCIISIDTTKYNVAKLALEAGANIINDISGLTFEPKFVDLAKDFDADLVIMHIQGKPRTMQINPQYGDVVEDVYSFLERQVNLATKVGIKKIYVDPGICFGKTLEQNLELLRNLDKFRELGPILLGISRKSMFKQMLDIENPIERDLPTLIMHTLLLSNDIEIIRVHNIEIFNTLKRVYSALHQL